jgi:HSP20 family protein
MRMLTALSPRLSRNQMDYMFGDFDHLINNLVKSKSIGEETFQPRCDVSETKDYYLASFDVPGIKKEEIKIEVHGTQMIISGERRKEVKNEEVEYNLHHERAWGKFERTFNLPTTVNTEKIQAQYENGVLNIAIPKAEAAKARTIQIQ